MFDKNAPIGVLDSGVGGISVLREMLKIMPNENYIYYGDSANAPYGEKSTEQVRELTFACVDKLLDMGIKGLCVACNTATSAAVRPLREMYPNLPLVGIEPAVKPASIFMEHPRVLVLATPVTAREAKLANLIGQYEDKATLIPVPCPGLMEFVENGDIESDKVTEFLRDLIAPYSKEKIDAIVLGCTHYPFVRKKLEQVVDSGVRFFDGGEGTAREMKRRLAESNLLSERDSSGEVQFITSCNKPEKLELCHRLLNL